MSKRNNTKMAVRLMMLKKHCSSRHKMILISQRLITRTYWTNVLSQYEISHQWASTTLFGLEPRQDIQVSW